MTYICPEKLISESYLMPEYDDNVDYDKELNIDEIIELPTYILREYLAKYKKNYLLYKIIKKELEDRGIYENKQYKLKKEYEIIETENINDSFKRRRKIKNRCY